MIRGSKLAALGLRKGPQAVKSCLKPAMGVCASAQINNVLNLGKQGACSETRFFQNTQSSVCLHGWMVEVSVLVLPCLVVCFWWEVLEGRTARLVQWFQL